jgi:beta-lactamase regulating signal transducer with metallopeptidase domain
MITLLDVVFDTSAILMIALLAMLLLRRSTAALRHWVLASALYCAALAPLAEMALPEWRLPVAVTLAEVPLPWAASGWPANPLASSAQLPAPLPIARNVPASTTWSLTQAAIAIWLTGLGVSLAMLAAGLIRLRQLTRRAVATKDLRWIDHVDRLSRAYGIASNIAILESESPGLLLVWGWRRPTLLVPASARAWDQERIVTVLRHELAHIRRGDWMTQVSAEIVRAIYWFNPLIWIACGRLHVECERACDDAVLDAGTDGSRYAEHLLDIARHLRPRPRWTPAPAIVRASTLERRVKAMLDSSIDRRPLTRRTRSLSLALLLAASTTVAALAAAQQFSSLTGTIVDSTNSLLPGVTLVLTNQDTKAKYEIKSDRTGRYEFVGLPPGTYVLESKLPGFAVFRGSVVITGSTVQQDMMLAVGTVQESITIVGGEATRAITPEQQREREEAKIVEQRKVEEYRAKRQAQAANCPGNPAGSGPAIGGNIRPPVKFRDVKPMFPERLRGTSGEVVLNAVIGTDGRVSTVDVVSTTHAEFAASTVDAVKQWVFDATLLNCTAIETAMQVSAHYRWQ